MKKQKIDENVTTSWGDNVAESILQAPEALTMADVWAILDALHTNFLDHKRDNRFISKWMNWLMRKYPFLEVP